MHMGRAETPEATGVRRDGRLPPSARYSGRREEKPFSGRYKTDGPRSR